MFGAITLDSSKPSSEYGQAVSPISRAYTSLVIVRDMAIAISSGGDDVLGQLSKDRKRSTPQTRTAWRPACELPSYFAFDRRHHIPGSLDPQAPELPSIRRKRKNLRWDCDSISYLPSTLPSNDAAEGEDAARTRTPALHWRRLPACTTSSPGPFQGARRWDDCIRTPHMRFPPTR